MTGRLVDDAIIPITGTKCGQKHQKTTGWLRDHSQFVCTCGVTIKIDNAEYRRQMADLDRAWENVGKDSSSNENSVSAANNGPAFSTKR